MSEAPDIRALVAARRLVMLLVEKHYPAISARFIPADDIEGLLLQIDNVTSDLVRRSYPVSPAKEGSPE